MKGFDPRLYLVTDSGLAGHRPLEEVVAAAVRGGVTAVQLREKEASTREYISLARRLKVVLTEFGVPLIINDRVDVALAAGAAGVHLGRSDMAYDDARRLLGPERVIGISIERLEQAREAELWDIAYIAASPVFPTPTKKDTGPAWGLEGLRRLRSASKHRIVAIGGVNETNAAEVMAAGADGIAVVSAVMAAEDPEAAARKLKEVIDRRGHGCVR
jgi:thiamine-phosphate pyrophosphorylase